MNEPLGTVALGILARLFVRAGIACNTAQARLLYAAEMRRAASAKPASKAETFSQLLKRIRAQEPASLPGYLEKV